jgi:hypothetical protein
MRLFSDIVTYLWFYIQIEGGLRSKRRTHTANLWSRWRPVADPERTAVFSIIFTKIEYDFRVCRRVCGTSNSFLKTGQVLFGELTSRLEIEGFRLNFRIWFWFVLVDRFTIEAPVLICTVKLLRSLVEILRRKVGRLGQRL